VVFGEKKKKNFGNPRGSPAEIGVMGIGKDSCHNKKKENNTGTSLKSFIQDIISPRGKRSSSSLRGNLQKTRRGFSNFDETDGSNAWGEKGRSLDAVRGRRGKRKKPQKKKKNKKKKKKRKRYYDNYQREEITNGAKNIDGRRMAFVLRERRGATW